MSSVLSGAWRQRALKALLLLVGSLTACASFEIMLAVLLSKPALLAAFPERVRFFVKGVYARESLVIAFLPECARYDPELVYTLKPGTCVFANTEFSTRYRINSLGLRGDEEMLKAPEVIVAGDSFAMGWGVEEDESYATRLAAKSGLRVLNSAIASYGTVREMQVLRRIDTRGLRYLIVHYCGNDYNENKEFFDSGRLAIMDEGAYLATCARHRESHAYFPGKHLWEKAASELDKLDAWLVSRRDGKTTAREVQYFLNALQYAGKSDLGDVQIIVVDTDPPPTALDFIESLRAADRSRYPSAIQHLRVLDLSRQLTREKYFVLDGHLNAAGHALVADELLRILAGKATGKIEHE